MESTLERQYLHGPSDDAECIPGVRAQPATESGPRMRILWVKVGGLWPLNTGGRLRSFNLISELSRDHDVSVLTTHEPREGKGVTLTQLPRCREVVSLEHASIKRNSARFALTLARSWLSALPVDLYKSRIPALEERVRGMLGSGEYDLCVADFLVAVPNVPMAGATPVVFFSHNVEYMIWQRLCAVDESPLRRAILALEWRKMRRIEAEACRQAGLTIAVSEEDRDQLGRDAPEADIRAIPTGVDIDYFKPSAGAHAAAATLVFTGSMDWHPNEDAMLYFIGSILPLVRKAVPQVTLTVVGRNPTQKLIEAAAQANVVVTGTVDDVRPYVEQAAVYVVPLRVGGGTRLKIFEALAMGKAVVSTTIGAEGLPVTHGTHLMRADAPEDFAEAVITLLHDEERRSRLGAEGRRLMEEKYAWPRVASEFADHCREAITR